MVTAPETLAGFRSPSDLLAFGTTIHEEFLSVLSENASGHLFVKGIHIGDRFFVSH
jgi:hypothetical protein